MTDYIELGGRKLRVEVNWNAYENILELAGKSSFDDLSELVRDVTPKGVKRLMAACINEGERLEGHSDRFTPEDIGAMVSLDGREINAFLEIYTRQSTPAVADGDSKKK